MPVDPASRHRALLCSPGKEVGNGMAEEELRMADCESHDDSELIDDRALDSAEGDRFGHSDFAEELTRTALQVRTPANIALYGAWGAGKTGLANLVRERIEGGQPQGVKFARFDAFKYAETPLRRHVISQIAEQLGIDNPRYSRGLYRQTQDTDFKMPGTKFLKLLLAFTSALGVVLVLAVGVVAVVAVLAKGSFAENLSKFIGGGLALAFAPAALVAGFVALTGKTLTFQRTIGAPSSDEEFETLFRDIVKDSCAERIVIFVDELDRCSASEVVETLDTIRTFLDIPGCVFIVAADQQVVEQALRRRVRQTTPVDVSNPYYSAGSAYLDKVFHYQLALPPLTPRRLSRFALDLVGSKAGLWNDVDREAVVSVLIPTHVRSPRRVKVLLNNFVLAYRLMARRTDAGQLDGTPRDRASELAKLVCLRTEFPLFAADLPLDARLPQFVLALHTDSKATRPPGATDEAWGRAGQYASGLLPVETNLAVSDPSFASTERPVAAVPPSGDEEDEERDETDIDEMDPTDALSHAQLQQLIAYLSRTQHVEGPRRDLVYLESSGVAFGLEPGLAEQLEDFAVDGRVDEVIRVFASLDIEGERAALRLLASRIREAPPGVEGQNAVSTLLRVLGSRSGEDFASVADELAEAIASPLAGYHLRAEDLSGAFVLGLSTRRTAGRSLVQVVLGRQEAIDDADLSLLLLANANRCVKPNAVRLGEVAANLLFNADSRGGLVTRIEEMAPEVSSAILLSAMKVFAPMCSTAKAAAEGTEEHDVLNEAESTLEAIMDSLLDRDDRRPAEAAVQLSLSGDTQGFRTLVEGRLTRIGTVKSEGCALALLRSCLPRPLGSWPNWLACIPREAPSMPQHAAALEKLMLRAWEQAVLAGDNAPTPEAVGETIGALAALVADAEAVSREALANKVVEDVGGPAADANAIAVQDQRLLVARQFCNAQLLRPAQLADRMLALLTEFAQAALPAQPSDSALVKHLLDWGPWLIDDALLETRQAFDAAIEDSVWLPSPERETLRLIAASSMRRDDAAAASPYTVDEIAQIAAPNPEAFSFGLSIWIHDFAATVEDVWAAARAHSRGTIPLHVGEALRDYASRLEPAERLLLASFPIRDDALDCPTEEFLGAIRFAECEQVGAIDLLIERYEQATNTAARRKVMRCWTALKPVADEHRRKLIEKIFLPLVGHDTEGYELAIEYLAAALPAPHGTKRRIGQAFLEQTSTSKELRQRASDKLRAAGLAKGKGLLGRGSEPVKE